MFLLSYGGMEGGDCQSVWGWGCVWSFSSWGCYDFSRGFVCMVYVLFVLTALLIVLLFRVVVLGNDAGNFGT